jgi:hypothetical protein
MANRPDEENTRRPAGNPSAIGEEWDPVTLRQSAENVTDSTRRLETHDSTGAEGRDYLRIVVEGGPG